MGIDVSPKNEKVQHLLKKLHLEDIVNYDEEKQWFDHKLSKGQQKRLALLYAIMQDKEIILLDEWAAEQDPQNRAYFYNTLLPEFSTAGKTVIAVTHDDEFFNSCTRKLKFNYGKLQEDKELSSVHLS